MIARMLLPTIALGSVLVGAGVVALSIYIWEMHELYTLMFSVLFPPKLDPDLFQDTVIGVVVGAAFVVAGVEILLHRFLGRVHGRACAARRHEVSAKEIGR